MIGFKENEQIIKRVRKHWLPFVFELSFIGLLGLIPFVVYVLIPESVITEVSIRIAGNALVLFIFGYLLWLSILWMVIFYIWTDYYLDVWIITSDRIVDVEQKGFFNRTVSSLQLDRIQDITISVNGIVASLLGFGNVEVQSAGTDQNFIIRNAHDPEGVKRIILEAYRQSKGEQT